MILHCFDPGETTGYCKMNEEGHILDMDNLSLKDLAVLLKSIERGDFSENSVFVIEDYKIFHGKQMAHTMKPLTTPEVLGMIVYVGNICADKVVRQSPQDKIIGYKWAGRKPPSNHNISHEHDAYAHGIYYLVTHHKLKPPAMTKLQKRK